MRTRFSSWALAAVAILGVCAAAAAAPSSHSVRNRFLLTLKLRSYVHWEQSYTCSFPTKKITSYSDKRMVVKTRGSTPVWLGMTNLDPRHPQPPPPRRFLPVWGGIHGFQGHGALLIPLAASSSVFTHLEYCDKAAKNSQHPRSGPTKGDFASTTSGNVGRMNLDIAKDIWFGYQFNTWLGSHVNVRALLKGNTVRFGQDIPRVHIRLSRGETATAQVNWHAVVRPA